MKIACVTMVNIDDPRPTQGRFHRMAQALRSQACEFYNLSPLSFPKKSIPKIISRKIYYKFLGRSYAARLDPIAINSFSTQIQHKMSKIRPNVIVSLMWYQPFSCLDTGIPMVIWTDGIFSHLLDNYPEYSRSRLAPGTVRDGLASEKAAIERSTRLIYFSDWAAQSAIDHYGLDPAKVRVLPVGPSFDPGLDGLEVEQAILSRPADRCRLVLVGMNWTRKGGDVALEVARRLNASGLPTELTVVGCHPPAGQVLPSWVTFTEYIDRSTPDGVERLRRLISGSHFMILPSQAETMGIVFCEASALGVPSLTTDVGGIPTVVKNGRNGWTFSLDADPDEYCRFVIDLFSDFDRYQKFAISSYEEYKVRLNWQSISDRLGSYLREI